MDIESVGNSSETTNKSLKRRINMVQQALEQHKRDSPVKRD